MLHETLIALIAILAIAVNWIFIKNRQLNKDLKFMCRIEEGTKKGVKRLNSFLYTAGKNEMKEEILQYVFEYAIWDGCKVGEYRKKLNKDLKAKFENK